MYFFNGSVLFLFQILRFGPFTVYYCNKRLQSKKIKTLEHVKKKTKVNNSTKGLSKKKKKVCISKKKCWKNWNTKI